MRVDRKFLLLVPSLVLVPIAAGLLYTASRLRQIVEASDSWAARDAYVASVERGERRLAPEKALVLVRLSLEAERRRTGAIEAVEELMIVLAAMTFGCVAVLLLTIRRVPRTEPLRGPVLFRTSPG